METEDARIATTLLAAMAEDGINPNALTAEQFAAMARLFKAGFAAGKAWMAESETIVL